jgi:GT2 family glycosyltransferase
MRTHRATIVISTRNRPGQLALAVESVLQDLPVDCNVVVVDQSDDDRTKEAVDKQARGSQAVTYHASSRRGLSAARNHGSRAAPGELLIFTDDDCTVDSGWCEAWILVFASNPRVGIGFGRVGYPPFDRRLGHIPSFELHGKTRTSGLELFRQGASAVGMGANMAVRRDLWELVGGFDEGLGAGTTFGGAEEIDLAYRIARTGSRIVRAVEPTVLHHGFRPRAEASKLVRGYAAGTGAMHAKHVRYGDMFAAQLLAIESLLLLSRAMGRLITGRRPLGLRSLNAYLRGAASSLRLPLDSGCRIYRAG